MLESPLPIIVYVSPDGARAASAGVWIVQAADIAAMAPQTNIGSSTPISVGGENIQKDLRRKVVNDAVASLKASPRLTVATAVGRAGRASGVEPDRERGARAGTSSTTWRPICRHC